MEFFSYGRAKYKDWGVYSRRDLKKLKEVEVSYHWKDPSYYVIHLKEEGRCVITKQALKEPSVSTQPFQLTLSRLK